MKGEKYLWMGSAFSLDTSARLPILIKINSLTCMYVCMCVCVCVCVCVCLCVCVCVCVCVFINFHRKGSPWLSKANVMPEFRSAMLCRGNNSVPNTFVATAKAIIAGTFKLAKCAKKCQLNRAKPREVKDNSLKLSQNQQ